MLKILACDDNDLSQLTDAIEHLERDAAKKKLKLEFQVRRPSIFLNVPKKAMSFAWRKGKCSFGNYDDPIGDIELFLQAGVDQVIIPLFDGCFLHLNHK